MATCPRCKGHLTEHHRYPRSPARKVFEISLAGLAGARGAARNVARRSSRADGILLVGGALADIGLDRWLRG